MAEAVLGVVSAGAGLLSLAIQLAESIQKLKSFQSKVKNAPTTLADLILELETMGLSLDLVERHQGGDSAETDLLARCLARCRLAIRRIQDVVDRMHSISRKRARLVHFYVAAKDPDVTRLLIELDQARGSLAFALLMFYSERQCRSDEVQHAMLQRQATLLDSIWAHTQANSVALETVATSASLHSRQTSNQHTHPTVSSRNRRGLVSADPEQDRHRNQSRNKVTQGEVLATIRLPRILFSQVWSVSLLRTSIGFTINLCASMGRDPDSEIFMRCVTGNTRAVQKLIHERQASLQDVSEGSFMLRDRFYVSKSFTLLQVRGHCDIITMVKIDLVTDSGLPWQRRTVQVVVPRMHGQGIDADELVDALAWSPSSQSTDTILRTCLDELEIDLSVDSVSSNGVPVASRLQSHHLKLLLEYQPSSRAGCTTSEMFEFISNRHEFMAAETFTQLVGMTKWSPELCTLGNQGFSTLHFAARMLAYAPQNSSSCSPAFSDWITIVATLLKHRVDPSQVAGESADGTYRGLHTTPFLELVKTILVDEVHRQAKIQSWLNVIQKAGLDLNAYGQREEIAWRKCQECWPEERDRLPFSYGAETRQWNISIDRSQCVPFWRLQSMPGTFPLTPPNPHVPKDICWEPDVFCDQLHSEDLMWGHVEDRYCLPRSIQISNTVADRWQDDEKTAQTVSDDSAIVVLMTRQRPRPVTLRTRSASLPPRKYGHRCNELGSFTSETMNFLGEGHAQPWAGQVHFCIATMTYEFGPFRSVRDCSTRRHFYAKINAGAIQSTRWWQFRSFLANICKCKDGWANRSMTPKHPLCPRHTGTRDCPQGCSKVNVGKLHVPEEFSNFHPRREFDERWDED